MQMLTQQEVFDKSVGATLKQGEPSYKDGKLGICAYRGADDLKCAVGHCISDETYDPKMDAGGIGAYGLFEKYPAATYGLRHVTGSLDVYLLYDLHGADAIWKFAGGCARRTDWRCTYRLSCCERVRIQCRALSIPYAKHNSLIPTCIDVEIRLRASMFSDGVCEKYIYGQQIHVH